MFDQPEIWRPVPGYDGSLEASSWGRIKRVARLVEIGRGRRPRLDPEHIYTQFNNLDSDGYRKINIRLDGKAACLGVHRLVCAAFHGPKPTPKHEAGHRDGNKLNNTPNNLAWLTRKQNAEDASRLGEMPRGEKQHLARLTEKQVCGIVQKLAAASGRERGLTVSIGRQYGVSGEVVCRIACGESWQWLTGIKRRTPTPGTKTKRPLCQILDEVRRAIKTNDRNTESSATPRGWAR